VLGRINAARPIGAGELKPENARAALAELGKPLALNAEQTASAVLRVVNARMAGEIRLMTVEQGHDPRDFALVCFGGAGPLHGAALVEELQIGVMLLPAAPGVLCAMGCALADVRHDFSQTVERVLAREHGPAEDRLDVEQLDEILAAQRRSGERRLKRDGMRDAIEVRHFADMSYQGQVHRLRVPIRRGWSAERLRAAFVERHRAEFAADLGDLDVRLVSARTTVTARRAAAQLDHGPPAGRAPQPRALRPVYFEEWLQTPVYAREDLLDGAELEGPLIVEQDDTTAVVEPGMRVHVDRLMNLLVTP
jgi:N-methylhydantoinase A